MEQLRFKVEDFEGPLDLLLSLVIKNQMNLYDIEIVSLIDQYLSVVQGISPEQMDAASEFIEMAARLVQMKSFLLLPKSEEAERMKEELTGLLVEYSLCKQVAASLKDLAQGVFIAVRQPQPIEGKTEYTLAHDPVLLKKAYEAVQGKKVKKPPVRQEQFEPLTSAPFVSVGARIVHVLRSLIVGKVKCLRQLFSKTESKSSTVATFLAVLELMRAGRIALDEEERFTMKR